MTALPPHSRRRLLMSKTITASGLLLVSSILLGQATAQKQDTSTPKGVANQQVDNLKQGGAMPAIGDPVPLKTKEGKVGWKMVIPGNRPLATPALDDGK